MKIFLILTFLLVIIGNLIAIISEEDTQIEQVTHQAQHPIRAVSPTQTTIVLVDVEVDINGKVLNTKLSVPQRYTSFNDLALLKAKKKNYPIKIEKGQPIKYWLKLQAITFSISSMNTPTKPFNRFSADNS